MRFEITAHREGKISVFFPFPLEGKSRSFSLSL
nr:MAG TPA: hypothetical protein [Caudoviricetes sp.]